MNEIKRFDQLKDGMLVVVHDSDIWGGTVHTGPDPSRVNLLDKAGRSRGILDKHNFHRREVTLLNGTLPPERCGWRGFAMTDSGAAEGCVLDAGHEGDHKFHTRCTHVLTSRRCVRESGHSGVHHYGPKDDEPEWRDEQFPTPTPEDERMTNTRLVNYRARAEHALERGETRVSLFAKDLLALTKELGHHRQGTAKPKTAAEAIAELDVHVRIEAGRMASSIHHGTIGTLLSHTRDCERYLRGES